MNAEQLERMGSPALVWAARLGLLFCAGAALWRVALYLYSALGGVALPIPVASLTFMPIPDAIFTAVFVWLALVCGRPLTAWLLEAGIIAGLLHAVTLISYAIIFRGWTNNAALGFDSPSTYLLFVIPALVCLAFSIHFARIAWRRWRASRRARLA